VTEIRVLIADDHAVVRQGLRTFLELQEDVEVVADVSDGEAALAAAAEHEPDVVLMDLVMPGVGGVEAIQRLREARPQARVLVLTSFLDDEKLFPAVRAGAAGYLLKDVEPDALVRAIRTVADGEALLHPAVAARLVEEVSETPRPAVAETLTARERDVLALIARGMPNKLIARELGIAEKTVKTHVSSILGKLGLTDRTQAALYAVRSGLLES
jgi:DNA-binding NarL/FixJ family response regulator